MALDVQTLNQYIGTSELGVQTTIMAEDMETACKVYADQLQDDPLTMQCTKKGVRTVLPVILVSFKTIVTDTTGVAKDVCSATPQAYTLPAGTEQVFTATPGEGFAFDHWEMDGVEVEGDEGKKAVALLTIPATQSILEIKAVFKAVTL